MRESRRGAAARIARSPPLPAQPPQSAKGCLSARKEFSSISPPGPGRGAGRRKGRRPAKWRVARRSLRSLTVSARRSGPRWQAPELPRTDKPPGASCSGRLPSTSCRPGFLPGKEPREPPPSVGANVFRGDEDVIGCDFGGASSLWSQPGFAAVTGNGWQSCPPPGPRHSFE